MNLLTIVARLTEKPNPKIVDGGRLLAKFRVTISSGKDNDKPTNIVLCAWDEQAHKARTLEKDDTSLFVCKTRLRTYQDEHGSRRRSLEPIVIETHPIGRETKMSGRQRAEYLGHLTADPVREGKRVRFSVAVNEPGEPESTQYVDCISFEPQATVAEKNLRKGMQVVVEGRYEIETYQSREGKTADSIRLLVDQNGLTIGWQRREDGNTFEEPMSYEPTRKTTPVTAITKTTPPSLKDDTPDWVTSDDVTHKPDEPTKIKQEKTIDSTVKQVSAKDFKAVKTSFLDIDAEIPF